MTSPRAGTGPDVIHARFDPDALTAWTPSRTFFVDPDLCRRYAAATNEPDPERWASGVAPPLLCVVATVPHVHTVLQQNLPERARAENRSVHGEHDLHYHEPVVPGSTLLVRGRLYGVHPRSTGTVLVTQVEMTDPGSGRVVHEEHFVNFLRGVMTDEAIGQAPAEHRLPDVASLGEPAATVSYGVDADQTFRYAEASGDHSIYHLDDTAARAAGFAGIIVHGLCTMAFAGRAVVGHACGGDASRLRRLAVRFSRPMYPAHTMTTTLWSPPERGEPAGRFRFQVNDDQGVTVITDGLAQVGPVGKDGEAT
ncbi:MAG TPA: dehydratase [Actinobacteria bacterium]|nr:dehydratase [Actinomycetota bacterium]